MERKVYYILILNNGYNYEDYEQWNAGLFKNLDDAIEFGKKNCPILSGNFGVEHWRINGTKMVGRTYCQRLNNGDWGTSK